MYTVIYVQLRLNNKAYEIRVVVNSWGEAEKEARNFLKQHLQCKSDPEFLGLYFANLVRMKQEASFTNYYK